MKKHNHFHNKSLSSNSYPQRNKIWLILGENKIIIKSTINVFDNFNQFAVKSAYNSFPSINLSFIIYRSST